MSSGPVENMVNDRESTKVEITNELWPYIEVCRGNGSTKVEITNELWPITLHIL